MGSFWKNVGKGLAKVAQGAAAAALWASQHPEVIQLVVAVASQAQSTEKSGAK